MALSAWGLFFFYLPSVLASAVLGLPSHALLTTFSRGGWGSYAVAGVLAGVLIWGVLAWFNAKICGDTSNPCLEDLSRPAALGQVLFWGVMPATAGALTFWAVMRPDRPAADTPLHRPSWCNRR
jgi:hypothetical protein